LAPDWQKGLAIDLKREESYMANKYTPAIVVALFNRMEPASRLLETVSSANYPNRPVALVISIDNDNNKNRDILALAEAFEWKYGEKEIIYHDRNLGLRDHFNFCGDLTEKYGSVVFLEDDLFVSAYYYDYLLQALDFYDDDEKVAGISLFNYTRIEQWKDPLPFTPVDDGYDNYFIQQASWGQVWTDKMWKKFRKWFEKCGNFEYINSLPDISKTIKGWPKSSWKKYYITYMIQTGKYYVFPRISLTANFDDVGIHRKANTTYYQSPLLVNRKKFSFSAFKDSLSIYDSYFEILPSIIKSFNPSLAEYDFEVNLYGEKAGDGINKELVLSKTGGKKNIRQFSLNMKPHELNIIFNRSGNGIFLAPKESLEMRSHDDMFVENLEYFYKGNFLVKGDPGNNSL
jgi:hypothetical protein